MNQILPAAAGMIASTGIIWAATMIFKRLLRSRLSPKANVAIWLVLIARLIVPVTFETGLHLVQMPVSVETAVPAELPVTASVPPAAALTQPASAQEHNAKPVYEMPALPRDAAAAGKRSAAGGPQHLNLQQSLSALWTLGVIVSLLLSTWAYGRLRRNMQSRLTGGSDRLCRIFRETLREVGIRRRVVLAVQTELSGPGLMYPNIVLFPANLLEADSNMIRMALRHELVHFLRKDHLKALGLSLLRAAWWFNPFVWLAVRSIRDDIETACDADVVQLLGKSGKAAYARTVLSMFGRTETSPAVLGMAFGGARRNAEKRIRGIYMREKSSRGSRAAAVLMAGVLGIACFTTACQPTPAQEAVVNQKEGIPQNALVGESETVDPQATTAPAAQYVSAGRWQETIDKAENFKIVADTDILTPDVASYPVEKLAPKALTQELADQLISYFTPSQEFYQLDQTRTKGELEELIMNMREALAADEALGNTEGVREDQEMIDELTQLYESAPETQNRTPATTEFTYARDYTGAILEDEGPTYINICVDGPDGSLQQISARQSNPDDAMQFPYFMYTAATFATEAQDTANQESLKASKSYAEALEEPYRSEELERLGELEATLERQLPLYAQNTVDLSEARQRGEQLLADLGLRGVQVYTADKALWTPYRGETDAAASGDSSVPSNPGVFLEFQRENGGIPCVAVTGQNGIPDSKRREYSAPFMPEQGSILFDSEWNVRLFTWESPTQPVEIVAPDSTLIPLDEVKERVAEELYRNELAVSETYIKEYGLEYDIEDMKLVMGYVDVVDEPDNALAVPAWYVRAQGRQLKPDGDGEAVLYNIQEVMISALDGAPILMPGSAQSYHSGPEEAD